MIRQISIKTKFGWISVLEKKGRIYRVKFGRCKNKSVSMNLIKFKTNKGDEIIVVQIAGLIARRIVCECSKSQTLQQGEKIGMIRFGSRVDIYFNNFKNLVKQNQTTVAGETLIAKK